MRKLTYLAVFEPSDDGYGVFFPDLPGCITWGDSFLSAEAAAKEALGLHLYGMEKDGEALPTPAASPVLDPETAPGALVSPVTVFPDVVRNEMDNRRVKTNITIPAWLKELAEQNGVNYSRLLETALMDCLGLNQQPHQVP